jgi:LAGLIDADG endonuclease
VGSPLPAIGRYDPVTTEPFGARHQFLSHPGHTIREMANPILVQHAGSRTALDIPSYLSGFFDGEGCFSISLSPRRKLRVGWEVRPSVSASQNEERSEVIRLAQAYFGCGTIRRDAGDRTVKWEVRSLPVLLDRVNPHFRRWPMLSAKHNDFELFDDVCLRMKRGDHLESNGLSKIVEIVSQMNPSGIRRFDLGDVLHELCEMKA